MRVMISASLEGDGESIRKKKPESERLKIMNVAQFKRTTTMLGGKVPTCHFCEQVIMPETNYVSIGGRYKTRRYHQLCADRLNFTFS